MNNLGGISIYLIKLNMDQDESRKIHNAIIFKWGIQQQKTDAISSVGAFLTAISKFNSLNGLKDGSPESEQARVELCATIAEVDVMMEQMACLFGADLVETIKEEKITTLKNKFLK
jgi:hypothetical protein